MPELDLLAVHLGLDRVLAYRDGHAAVRLDLRAFPDLDGRRRIARRERLRDRLVPCVAVVDAEGLERVDERALRLSQRDAVLGPAGPRERGLDRAEVELDHLGVVRLVLGLVPERVLLAVRLDEGEPLLVAAGQPQVLERLVVDREEAARRAVLGRHVPDRRPVGERQGGEPGPEVLDELPDDARLAKDLRHGQHEVGRGRSLRQRAAELEADDLRDQHRHGLAEHRRLGLDAADAPTEDPEPVDHRRVRVRPDQRVGERPAVA